MRAQTIGVVVCTATFSAAVLAQEQQLPAPAEVPSGLLIPAEPLKRGPPSYPSRALSQMREGWAMASFIITEEGEVIEPMIEESSHPDFDAPTLRAVSEWRYKPATLDGTPVEQSMVQTILRYHIEGIANANGASREFIAKYREIASLIAAKNAAAVAPLLEALEQGELNFYEDAWLAWLQYGHLESMGTTDSEVLMDPLRRALGSSGADDNYLEPDIFVTASQRLYALSVRTGDLSGAVTVFERLEASRAARRSDLYEEVMARLDPLQDAIRDLVSGPKVLQQAGRVDDSNYWVHRLLRRSFALGDVQGGELELFDVRCTRANRRFTALPDTVVKIPDSWGDCSVYIKGEPGTTFAFEEYAPQSADPADGPPPR